MKIKILILICGLGIIGMITFVVVPCVQDILEKREQIKIERQLVNDLEIRLKRAKAVKNTSLEKLEKVLPSNKPGLTMMNEIEKICLKSGVLLDSFSINPGNISTPSSFTKDVSAIDLQISIKAKITDFQLFLKNIKENSLQMSVKSFSYTYDTYRQDDTLNISLPMVAYYQARITSVSGTLELTEKEEKTLNELIKNLPDNGSGADTNIPVGKLNPFGF